MKLLKCVLVLICLLAFCETSEAQLFRGRFMQKIRDDLSGASKQKAQQQLQLEAQRRQQELARKKHAAPNAKTPTPARPKGTQQTRGQVDPRFQQQQRQQQIQRQQAQPSRRSSSRETEQGRFQQTPVSGIPEFGMSINEQKDGTLVVSKLHPRGNAAQAGLRSGDVIVEVGSVELTNKKEYDSIIDIMTEGDQMEFVISRRGKEQKVMVQYGDLPEKLRNAEQLDEDLGPAIVSDDAPGARARGNVDFVPQDTRRQTSGMDSVMDGRISTNSRTQYSRSTPQQLSAQDREIMRLRAEIEQLRRMQQQKQYRGFAPAPREPVGPRIGQ